MGKIFFNPLSACSQYHSVEAVRGALAEIVACFKYVLPALEKNTLQLVYDDTIELRALTNAGGGFFSEINHVGRGDLMRQWFIYTRNRARRASLHRCEVTLSGQTQDMGEVRGELRPDILGQEARWLGFGGTQLGEQQELTVAWAGGGRESVRNAFGLNSFQLLLPQYIASPKHRKEGYFAGGEWVSPMPLRDEVAQQVLLTSIAYRNEQWAYFDGEYYCFRRTFPNQEVYHGFSPPNGEVPEKVLQLLR